MTDRPIIFSAPMIRALLDGRKTMTRRIVKPQPVQNSAGLWVINYGPSVGFSQIAADDVNEDFVLRRKMPCVAGDRLWVREKWAAHDAITIKRKTLGEMHYWADYPSPLEGDGRWRPSIHMPRWASRLTLTVTDLRVERLQDISEHDAVAEGLTLVTAPNGHITYQVPELLLGQTASRAYRLLWETLHGPDAWEANPWVCAISFTVQRGNIDKIGGTND